MVTPQATQHYLLLQRNLVYTESRGARSWWCSSGSGRRWAIAVRNNKTEDRFSGLLVRLTALWQKPIYLEQR